MSKGLTIRKNKIYLISLVLFVLLNLSFYQMSRYYATINAEEKVEDFLLNVKALRNFVSNSQKNEIYLLQTKNILDKDFFTPVLMSSTFISKRVNEEYNELRKSLDKAPITIRFSSDNPRNPSNLSTPFEKELLKRFNDKEMNVYKDIVDTDYGKALYYAIPTKVTTDACMRCHSTPDIAPKGLVELYGDKAGFYEHKGNIRAMLSSLYPLQTEIKDANFLFVVLLISTSILFATIMIFFYKYNQILEKSNEILKQRVNLEIENNREKDIIMFQQSKMASMGEMLENIAHQWRQPLSSMLIKSSGTLLHHEMGIANDDMYKNTLEDITKNIDYLTNTINDFKEFFANHKVKRIFNLKNSVDKSINLISSIIDKNEIKIYNNIADDIELNSIENEFVQVFLNLINNAKDALVENNLDEARYIFIDSKIDENSLELTILDNAKGIPQEYLARVLEQYFTTKGEEGSGIGLYMTKEIIEKHFNGKFSVENSKYSFEGKEYIGAKFTICLSLNS